MECVRPQDASFEPLAAFVDLTCEPEAVRKEKNRHLTANFAQPRPV